MGISELERERCELIARRAPIDIRISQIDCELRSLRSKEFIRVNGIEADQIQQSRVDGVWHGTTWAYGKWLAETNCDKPWCEWNGILFRTSDMIRGTLDWTAAHGLMEDVWQEVGSEE